MMQIHPMWRAYPALAQDLSATLNLIEKQIKPSNKPVATAILDMINAGGKLLRPAYCLLFAQFHEHDKDQMIALAGAVETLHTATLVHDDIIDKATTRRGLPTIAATFGQDVAVYAGDYLFVVCFKLLANYAGSLRSVQQDGISMEKILNGELEQMSMRYQLNMTIEQYLSQVSGKTGQLFALACFIGAYESGSSLRFAKAAEQTGMQIGIAFQLLDDILDYTATSNGLGKPTQEDMRQGVYSAPLILAMSDHRDEFAAYLSKKADMSDADVAAVAELVARYQGVQKARQMAEAATAKALRGLAKLPDSPAKTTLMTLTTDLLSRKS